MNTNNAPDRNPNYKLASDIYELIMDERAGVLARNRHIDIDREHSRIICKQQIAEMLAKHCKPAAVSADAVDGGWYRIDEVTPPHEETVLLYIPATEFSPYEIEAGWASGGELITFPDGRQSISTRWWHGSATHWKPIGPLPAALSPETVCGGE